MGVIFGVCEYCGQYVTHGVNDRQCGYCGKREHWPCKAVKYGKKGLAAKPWKCVKCHMSDISREFWRLNGVEESSPEPLPRSSPQSSPSRSPQQSPSRSPQQSPSPSPQPAPNRKRVRFNLSPEQAHAPPRKRVKTSPSPQASNNAADNNDSDSSEASDDSWNSSNYTSDESSGDADADFNDVTAVPTLTIPPIPTTTSGSNFKSRHVVTNFRDDDEDGENPMCGLRMSHRNLARGDDSTGDGHSSDSSDEEERSVLVEIEFTVVERGGKRGEPKLIDSHGYVYNKLKDTPRNTTATWVCECRDKDWFFSPCPARVTQINSMFRFGFERHTHSQDSGADLRVTIRAKARELAEQDPSRPAREVAKSARTAVLEQQDWPFCRRRHLPTKSNLVKIIRRHRQALQKQPTPQENNVAGVEPGKRAPTSPVQENTQPAQSTVSSKETHPVSVDGAFDDFFPVSAGPDVEYDVIHGAGRKGAPRLVSNQGYIFTKKRETKGGVIHWACSVIRKGGVTCYGLVKQDGDEFDYGNDDHIHRADPNAVKRLKVVAKAKGLARLIPDMHSRQIANYVLACIVRLPGQEDSNPVYKRDNLVNMIDRYRKTLADTDSA